MERSAVESSNVAEIGYDPETQVLEVLFRNGGLYHYHGVPRIQHAALMAAPSKGIFLQAIKRDYPCRKVTKE